MTDVAVAIFVALLVFGAMHLPRLGDALGRAMRRRAGKEPAEERPGPKGR